MSLRTLAVATIATATSFSVTLAGCSPERGPVVCEAGPELVAAVDQHLTRAEAALGAEDFEKAFAAFEAAGALQPHAPKVQQAVQRALLRRAAARPAVITDESAPRLMYAADVFADDTKLAPERLTVEAHLALARGEAEFANSRLDEAIALRPDYPHAHLAKATILRLRGDKLGAVASFEKAVAAAPKNLTALNNTGVAYLEYERHDDALRMFEDALRVLDNASTRLNAADASLKLKRRVEAEEHLKRAVALAPRSAEPLRRLGALLEEKGDKDDAIAVLGRAMKLEFDVGTCFKVGVLLQEKGKHGEALQFFGRVAAAEPSSHAVYYHMAFSFQAMSDMNGFEQAIQRYLQFAENVPSEEERRKEAFQALSQYLGSKARPPETP